jgi:nitrite reductase/ring-hydroxylating ferredoxin subunit/uncharacterized membrane protein
MNPEYNGDGPVHRWSQHPLLTRLADAVQPAVQSLMDSDDPARRPIKDFLHGTFLGHALHPMLTDIPVGAWTVAATCDALEICGAEGYGAAADTAIAIGAAGAVAAAVTGLADWSDTSDEPRRVGMLHASLNTAALTCYAASLFARRSGGRRFGIAAAFAGYALVGVSAYLGGELSLGMQLGVKRTAVPIDPPQEFTRVLDETALNSGVMHSAQVAGIPLLVTRFDDTVRAVAGVCTHRGAPLADGRQEGRCVRCPWHGSRFSLEDGSVVEGPATFGLARFETQRAGGAVSVRSAN